jgi:hypothetical protein
MNQTDWLPGPGDRDGENGQEDTSERDNDGTIR